MKNASKQKHAGVQKTLGALLLLLFFCRWLFLHTNFCRMRVPILVEQFS